MSKPQKQKKIVYGKKSRTPQDSSDSEAVSVMPVSKPRAVDMLKMNAGQLAELAAEAEKKLAKPAQKESKLESGKEENPLEPQKKPKNTKKDTKKPNNKEKTNVSEVNIPQKSQKKAKKPGKRRKKIVYNSEKASPAELANCFLRRKWGHIALIIHYNLPLAIGSGNDLIDTIHAGLIAHRYLSKPSRRSIRSLLLIWTRSKPYLLNLAAPGSLRYYPDLRVAGPVSDEHRQDARNRLKKRYQMTDAEIDTVLERWQKEVSG